MDGLDLTLEEAFRGRPITFRALALGRDLLVVLSGGERPHVGSIVMAEPRASTAEASRLSTTCQVWNRPPHKEEAVARPVAEALALRLNKAVVVVSGIHYEGLDEEGLEAVGEICFKLLERYLSMASDG